MGHKDVFSALMVEMFLLRNFVIALCRETLIINPVIK